MRNSVASCGEGVGAQRADGGLDAAITHVEVEGDARQRLVVRPSDAEQHVVGRAGDGPARNRGGQQEEADDDRRQRHRRDEEGVVAQEAPAALLHGRILSPSEAPPQTAKNIA